MIKYAFLCSLLFIATVAQFGQFGQGAFNPFGQGDASIDLPMQPSQTFGSMPSGFDMDSDEPDSGNWYQKLHWWKEAKRVYTVDIRDAIEHLKSVEKDYEVRKNDLLGKLEAYYKSLPVKRTEAIAIIDSILEDLKKQQEPEKNLPQTKEQIAQAAELADNQRVLEALRHDFEQFNTLANRLTEAFNDVFVKQIEECRRYDEKALDYFERIEKVLDDQKAQSYYDVVENSLENIRAITTYLIGPLQIFIDQAWTKLQPLMPQIKKTIEDLEKKGIRVRVLTETEKAEQLAKEKEREAAHLKALAEKKAADERKAMPWWKRWFYDMGGWISSFWSSVKSFFGGLFGGGKPVKEVAKQAAATQAAPSPQGAPSTQAGAQAAGQKVPRIQGAASAQTVPGIQVGQGAQAGTSVQMMPSTQAAAGPQVVPKAVPKS